MMERFQDKVVIVTGGSRGIGLATCKSFAQEGAMVVIASIDEGRGQAAANSISAKGAEAIFIQADVPPVKT